MLYGVALVSVSYLVPLLVATGADPRAQFCDGCLVAIASDVVAPWLGAWITCAAAVSCVGLFIAEMASDSFQVQRASRRSPSARARSQPAYPGYDGATPSLRRALSRSS